MRTAWLALVTTLVLALVGCTPPAYTLGGLRDPHPVRKIVSLSPSTTEVVGEIQLTPYIVGRTSSCDYPFDVKDAIVVVQGTKPDFEKIAKIKPDLVVYDAKLYSNTDLSKLKELNTMVEPMDVDTVSGLIDYILDIGGKCDMAMFGSKTADQVYGAMENAKAVAPAKKVRVAVMTGGTGDFLVAGKDSFLADVIRICGGEPVGPPGNIFAPLSPEALVVGDPEIILVAEGGAKVIADSRLQSVAAIKAKPKPRVYQVAPAILLRTSPRCKDLIETLSNLIVQTAQSSQGNQG